LQPKLLSKKIRQALESQRERLRTYLDLLEQEEKDIMDEDPDRLNEHLSVERRLLMN
jgi:hypothetical protein